MEENMKREETEEGIAIETGTGGIGVREMEIDVQEEDGKKEMTGGTEETGGEMVIEEEMIEEDHQDLGEMMTGGTEGILGGGEMKRGETEKEETGTGGKGEEMRGMEEKM